MIPATPNIIGTLYRNKSIFVNWSHPSNEVIEQFTISYSCIVLECMGSPDCSGHNNVKNMRRNYTIKEVEEDSDYTITIIAELAESCLHHTQLLQTLQVKVLSIIGTSVVLVPT